MATGQSSTFPPNKKNHRRNTGDIRSLLSLFLEVQSLESEVGEGSS